MRTLSVFLLFVSMNVCGQENLTEQAKPIVDEGKKLYRSEMASWYGTDLFISEYKERANIGGYFSYVQDGFSKCIFFSKSDDPKVIGTIGFDSTYNVKSAEKDFTVRDFTKYESDIYAVRKIALMTINSDTLFKTYGNTNLNLIPLIDEMGARVYVLTGPEQTGVVIFGNDYLLNFDDNKKLIGRKRLHNNIISVNYGGSDEKDKEIEGSIHSHLPETGDYITATDICTLMLYEKYTKWKQHNVVSKNYLNIWDCKKDQLTVLPMSTIEKIYKDQEKQKKEKIER